MKVCMLVEALPPAYSGAARQSLQLAARLRATGTDVFFVGAQVVSGSPTADIIEGFRAYRVPFTTRGKWTKLRMLTGYCRLFLRHRREFDVLHIHGPYYLTLAAAMFAKYSLRKKILLKLTSIAMDTPSAIAHRGHPGLAFNMFRRADAIVCMSSAQYDDCLKHGLSAVKLHRIPNGVAEERFGPLESAGQRAELLTRLGLSTDSQYAVFIGSIEVDKGVELLVDAARAVCAARSDVKFLLIGPDGRNPGERHIRPEFVDRIRQKIKEGNLSDRVLLLGRLPNPDDYLRAAAMFVFTSRSEGFGTVLIEAMAAGLPCIALNIPGVTTDIITTKQDGLIIEGESPEAFAAAIVKLAEDPALRASLGARARETVLQRFDFPAIAQRYTDVYAKLLSTE
jgi:glycosyltransferase involved in cell wall biosynthesis